MAITVRDSDVTDGRLASGLDQLVVLGVDWSRSPETSADELSALFENHLHSEGMALARQGLATNNTSSQRSGYVSSEEELRDALDPGLETADGKATSNGRRLAAALGLRGVAGFDRLPHADLHEDANAGHMNNALWEATIGYFLEHMLDGVVTRGQAAGMRAHFRRYVRGRGVLPAIRIGDQPYGVLPVVPASRWRASRNAPLDTRMMTLIKDFRGLWAAAVRRSPHMGRTGDSGKDLLEVLQHTPLASSVRFRSVFGPLYVANTAGLERTSALQELTGRWTLAMAGVEAKRPRLGASVINPSVRRLTVPFVQRGGTSENDGLTTNYIGSIARRLRRVGGFVSIRKDDPQSLLHALLAHGAQLEVGKAASGLVTDFKFPAGSRPPKIATGADPELVGVETDKRVPATPVRLAERKVNAITGNRTLANHIATIQAPSRVPATKNLASFRASLDHLAGLPSAELERLFLEALDCSSHRLDAWLNSFAAKRLDELRSQRPVGVFVGGYGWVESLRPDTAADSLGYIHTPSMAHAATAAILRSGHLNHVDDEASPLAIDLSSSRVRDALGLIDGARQGQQIGALLGYRVERALREHRPRLARYILPFRLAAPLGISEDVRSGNIAAEAIAARDVVDGVKLLERWKADESGLFKEAGVATDDRGSVRTVLERLDDRLDAVADVLVSESVYQSVVGNLDRAGAATAALDRQMMPPEPDVVRTPRTGQDHVYRLAVITDSDNLPASWVDAPTDARAAAEPRLNAWSAAMLGDPHRFRFAAEVLDADGAVIEILEARLTDLGLSPLSVLESTGIGGSGEATELEERLAAHFSRMVSAPEIASQLVLLDGVLPGWARSAVSLSALLALCGSTRRVVAEGRPLEPADLELPEQPTPPVVDAAELTMRADAAVATAQQARDDLSDALGDAPRDAEKLRQGLSLASNAGTAGAIPVALGSGEDDVAALVDQATLAVAALKRSLEDAASADEGTGTIASQVARIKAVFGQGFPVVPVFTLGDSSEVAASLADVGAITGGDRLAAAKWLQRMAIVQQGAAALSQALDYAEMSGGDVVATDLSVIQLPHTPGAAWFATGSRDGETGSAGRVSIVAHAHTGMRGTGALAGVVIDEWRELVPNTIETTGVAFHYDAPAARAPQAILLAVPPDPGENTWDFDTLADTVREALDLAKIRAVDPQQLWMAGRFLPALYVAHNVAQDTASINFHAIQALEDLLAVEDT
ncbi:MAG: hypothetical protein ABFR53_02075 [Actinomycetota bacterium]